MRFFQSLIPLRNLRGDSVEIENPLVAKLPFLALILQVQRILKFHSESTVRIVVGMSFGGAGGGSRGHSSFGGKGVSQKKERKKKQEFHRHKVRYVEEEQQLDFPKLKERVSISLQKLGQQVFSAEPGGYSLQDWMKSFNFLLDDFEEKVGLANLSKDYFTKRQELTVEILKPVDTSDLDLAVEEIQKEEDQIKIRIVEQDRARRQKLEEERHSAEDKIGTLKKNRESTLQQIEKEKEEARKKKEAEASGKQSFFKRFFGSSKKSSASSNTPQNKRIAEQESEAGRIQNEIDALEQENVSKAEVADSAHKNDIKEESIRLEELRERTGELESIRAERLQLSEKRLQVTSIMAETISQITLNAGTRSAENKGVST